MVLGSRPASARSLELAHFFPFHLTAAVKMNMFAIVWRRARHPENEWSSGAFLEYSVALLRHY